MQHGDGMLVPAVTWQCSEIVSRYTHALANRLDPSSPGFDPCLAAAKKKLVADISSPLLLGASKFSDFVASCPVPDDGAQTSFEVRDLECGPLLPAVLAACCAGSTNASSYCATTSGTVFPELLPHHRLLPPFYPPHLGQQFGGPVLAASTDRLTDQVWTLPSNARFIVLDSSNLSASCGDPSCRVTFGHFWARCSGQIRTMVAAPMYAGFAESVIAQVS